MELLRFLHISLIDQYDAIETFGENSIVYNEDDSYFLIVPVSNDVCALYLWENYLDFPQTEHLQIVQKQIEKASVLFRENIRLLVDTFPRTCVNEVNTLHHLYGINVTFIESNCGELGNYELVKLYYDSANKCWFVKVYNKVYAFSNEKAARRVQEIIYYDSVDIIERRWH